MTSLEQLVAKVRSSSGIMNMQFSWQELAEGLQNAASRLEHLEAMVKQLQAAGTTVAPGSGPTSTG